MDRYTNLNLYGHLALELGADNNSGGSLTNVPTSDISFLRFTGANPVIQGLDPGHGQNNNKILVITFLGTGSLTFKHLSTSNSSNNFRIKTPNGEDYTIPINYGSILIYDSYDNFWHIVGEAKLAAGSNGEIQFNNNGALRGNSNLTWDVNNNILNVSGTTYSTALFDNGKRVATLTGTETLENKTLVSPVITGTLTFGEIPFYQYGHHGISIFEDVDLSQSPLQTVYNFGTPDSEKSSVLSLSVKDEYKAFIGTSGNDELNIFTIGSTSNNTNFQIQKGTVIQPVDLITGITETTLLFLNSQGQLSLPVNIPSTSYNTGSFIVSGGVGIGGETFFKDHLNLTFNKSIRFYDNDSNYIALKSPSNLSTNYTYTLPSSDGTNGQALITNGSGTLSFTTVSQIHNDLQSIQGGGNSNYYHSNQPINTTDSVQFAGLNINGSYTLPTSDGTNGQALITNSSGVLSFTTINQVHNNLTSIQGGTSGNYYHSNQPINTSDSVIFNNLNTTLTLDVGTNAIISGTLTVKGIKFPESDGTNGQFIQTDGNGNLTFQTLTPDFVTITTSGNIDSYDTSDEACFRFTAATSIRGLSGGVDGKIIYVYNISGSSITLVNQSSSPTANSRIITGTGGDIIINNDSGILLQYDGTSSRWRTPSIGKAFPIGDIVGTSDSQTLTNKTLEDVNLTKDITITSSSTVTSSGSITSLTTADISVIKYNSTSQGTLHGLADGVDGKILIITNINTGKLLIASDSSTETTASNRIITQGDVNLSLRYKTSMIFQYDGTSSRWRVINRHAHNDSSEMQGGDGTNFYHSNQEINTTSSVQFAGLNINGTYTLPTSDGTSGQALITNGSGTLAFQNVLMDVVQDTTPQLGGNLDVNGKSIISTSNGNIIISPHGTGKFNINSDTVISGTITVSNITYPINDGTNGQVIKTDGNGNLSFSNVDIVYSNYNYGNISSSSSLNLSFLLETGYFTHTNASSSVITLTNGVIGKTYKIIGNSNGIQYSFSTSGVIKWPTGITPIISANGKSDLFVFECIGTNKYLGYYFYNYDSTGLF